MTYNKRKSLGVLFEENLRDFCFLSYDLHHFNIMKEKDFQMVWMSFSDIQTPTSQWFSPVSWIFLCTFLDILSQLSGYSFTAPWIFFRSLQISWATLYIIFQTSKLVSGSCSIGIRLPFGLCPIVVRLVFDCHSARVRLLFNWCSVTLSQYISNTTITSCLKVCYPMKVFECSIFATSRACAHACVMPQDSHLTKSNEHFVQVALTWSFYHHDFHLLFSNRTVLCTFPQSFPLKSEFRNNGIDVFRVLFQPSKMKKKICARSHVLYI